MIKVLPCLGIKHGKKNGKDYSIVWVDVTECIPDEDAVGQFVSDCYIPAFVPNHLVGTNIACSVDRFGRLQDIEY